MKTLVRTLGLLLLCATLDAQNGFVNWENAHVSPLDRTPDGTTLLAVNTPDSRLERFQVAAGQLTPLPSIPVGLEPVSVRARTNDEVWVVNHLSDTVSVVSLSLGNVIATLGTEDEPADVVFAGSPERAFVSCSQENSILVFDPSDLTQPPQRVAIQGEDPRALAVSPDGMTVYAAIFESGNGTTIVGGGQTAAGAYPPNGAIDPLGPYGGNNPPPNAGAIFEPPMNPANPAPPTVSMIVRRDSNGDWRDDNGADWSDLVSGANASLSGRVTGWDVVDNDVAMIDTSTLAVTYQESLLNVCAQLAVNPATGQVAVVGSQADNEIRFEPVINGIFARMEVALFTPGVASGTTQDLNGHLDYSTPTLPQGMRDQSLGDPRGIIWNSTGTRAYVSGKGSNNLVILDANGVRVGLQPTVEVGQGPTGMVLDEGASRLYVLNHFSASITVVDTVLELPVSEVQFYDPTPTAIRAGREHLYGTHETSGLGHLSCASCHIDARMDKLAWDLGDPSGEMRPFNQNCVDQSCEDWHPMKGPMTTQTLQDIIGKEPHHWRGDRDGIEEFNDAFLTLLGDDAELTTQEMQEFEDFLATIHFPPNPFRNFDNTLSTNLPLPGHFTTGRFGPAGLPLPNGDAQQGLFRYRTAGLDGVFNCVSCHTLPAGVGGDGELTGAGLTPLPPGPNGERHLFVTSSDGFTNETMAVPHLRNLYEKVGFDTTQVTNVAGFGFFHDGSIDSLARVVNQPFFGTDDVQDTADLVAFLLSFSGSDLPLGSLDSFLEVLGPSSQDTHAAVGAQLTIDAINQNDLGLMTTLSEFQALADVSAVGMIAKGVQGGMLRGYVYQGGVFQSDRASESLTVDQLRLAAGTGNEITVTLVPAGSEVRMGVDRDADSFFDLDEVDACSDPTDPLITPDGTTCGTPEFVRGDCNGDGAYDIGDPIALLGVLFGGAGDALCLDSCDANDDGAMDIADAIRILGSLFSMGLAPAAPFPDCGTDPTMDMLDCIFYVPCP